MNPIKGNANLQKISIETDLATFAKVCIVGIKRDAKELLKHLKAKKADIDAALEPPVPRADGLVEVSTRQWAIIQIVAAFGTVESARNALKAGDVVQTLGNVVVGQRLISSAAGSCIGIKLAEEKASIEKTRQARIKGALSKAKQEAARFQPAINEYLNTPRLQRLSYERAAIELTTKRGHHVSVSVLKRKLSAAKKQMPSA
jgi:hypothetical protein